MMNSRMSAAPARSSSLWTVLAGILLLVDGIVALIVSALLALFSIAPPPAAIEGRAPIDQTQWPLTLVTLLFAIACLWAAQRALRGIRAGRVVGVAAAGIVVVLAGWFLVWLVLQPRGIDLTGLAIVAAMLAPQVLAIVALLRWPPATADRSVQPAIEGNRA